MKANWLPLSAAVALALGSVTASAVDFHGYMRAGIQANTEGGDVYCLGNGNNGHKVGRLADECDTYAELALSQEVYNKANSKFTVNTLVAYGTNEDNTMIDRQGNSWQGVGGTGPWANQRISFREAYAKYDTADGYSIWAGKRFYKRKDIHILDLYYLNNSGYGTGIENIDTGIGQASFAVTKWANDVNGDNAEGWRNVYKLDARLDGINVGFGSLDVDLIYALPFTSDAQKSASYTDEKGNKIAGTDKTRANSGYLATLEHTYVGGGLMNKFVVQYGNNGFAYVGAFKNHAGDNYTPDVDAQGVRLIDWGTFDVGDFGLGYSLLWGHINSGDNHAKDASNGIGFGDTWTYPRSGWEYSIVVRPEYKWTEYTRTTMELGFSKMKTTGFVASEETAKDPSVYKVTLAQQFTPGKGFWTRPAIRFYVSYLGGTQYAEGWHPSYSTKNKDGNNYQITFGSQVEAWW